MHNTCLGVFNNNKIANLSTQMDKIHSKVDAKLTQLTKSSSKIELEVTQQADNAIQVESALIHMADKVRRLTNNTTYSITKLKEEAASIKDAVKATETILISEIKTDTVLRAFILAKNDGYKCSFLILTKEVIEHLIFDGPADHIKIHEKRGEAKVACSSSGI